MKMIDSLVVEFEHEAQTTRKHLERLPSDKPTKWATGTVNQRLMPVDFTP